MSKQIKPKRKMFNDEIHRISFYISIEPDKFKFAKWFNKYSKQDIRLEESNAIGMLLTTTERERDVGILCCMQY